MAAHPKSWATYTIRGVIDGCDHEWFEVFVDDATSALMELRFCESESAFAYFTAMRSYLEQHGKPVALYSDKATVFRAKEPRGGTGVTQFSRVLSSLNIEILCANTPAARGRVERAHLTLQDRLVKELRLREISDVEAANAFGPEFIADYNRRFARTPRSEHDAHRPSAPSDDLARIFSWQEIRLVPKSLTLNYQRLLYVLAPTDAARTARGKRVGIEEREDGSLTSGAASTSCWRRLSPRNTEGATAPAHRSESCVCSAWTSPLPLILQMRDRLGATVLCITHDLTAAFKIADRIVYLFQGKVMFQGAPEETRACEDPVVRQFISGSAHGPIAGT